MDEGNVNGWDGRRFRGGVREVREKDVVESVSERGVVWRDSGGCWFFEGGKRRCENEFRG